jgi:hypothetical protein
MQTTCNQNQDMHTKYMQNLGESSERNEPMRDINIDLGPMRKWILDR